MANNLGQTLSSLALSASIFTASFTAVPLPNASSLFVPVAVSQEQTASVNYYQQLFTDSPRQQAMNLFGELRDFTEQEQVMYQMMIAKASKPIGINLFDLYK